MRTKYLFGLILIIVSFSFLYKMYGEVLIAPNSYMLSTEGEAARLYYVFTSHAKIDSTYTNFQGMNYPYGEHIVFCDAQPLLANSFKFIVQVFPQVVNYAIGIQNFISLYGLIVGAALLYLFLLRWQVAPWYAVLTAFSIMTISPQVLRMPWHPSLAYFFFIPLLLLLFQQYIKKQNLKWTFIILLINLGGYFLNPYLGVIATIFFGIIMLYLLYTKGWKKRKYYLFGFTQALLPGVIYQFYVKLTDVRIDRVDLPTGLHEFTATFSTVFTSPYTPFKSFYESLGVNMVTVQQHFEGMAYVGFGTTFLLLFFLGWMIVKRKFILVTTEQRILIIIACSFFILAIGFPFVFHPSMEKLLEIFKPLRQLRALGRMIWMTAFCIHLIVFGVLYFWIRNRIKSKRAQSIAYAIVVFLLLLNAYEGSYLHQETNSHQKQGNVFTRDGLKNSSQIPYVDEALNKADAQKYSAIVPIPFFHVGSELFVSQSHTTYQAMLEVIAFAYHTNLPLTASYLSRLSVTESKKSLQFFAPPMIKKEVAHDFHDERPLLIFYSKSAPIPSEEELRLVQLGDTVYNSELISLIEIKPEQVWKTNSEQIKTWYVDYKDRYTQEGNVYYYGPIAPIDISYDQNNNDLGMNGAAFTCEENEKKYFFDQQRDAKELPAGNYEVSFWMETSLNRMQSALIMEKIDRSGVVVSKEELYEAKRSYTIVDNWIRWQQLIQFDDKHSVRLYIRQPSNQPGILLDNLLIMPENMSVFKIENENWWWNNYPLSLN